MSQRKRSQRPPQANVVSTSKYGRIVTSDVESPPLLPLLLLLLDAAACCCCHCCCSNCRSTIHTRSPCASYRQVHRKNHQHTFCSRLDVNNLWRRRWRRSTAASSGVITAGNQLILGRCAVAHECSISRYIEPTTGR